MPHGIGLASNGHQAYVTNEGDHGVAVVDDDARSVVMTVSVGAAPRKIVLQP